MVQDKIQWQAFVNVVMNLQETYDYSYMPLKNTVPRSYMLLANYVSFICGLMLHLVHSLETKAVHFLSASGLCSEPPVPVSVHPTTTSCPLFSWRTVVAITSLCLLAAFLGRKFPCKWPCCPSG